MPCSIEDLFNSVAVQLVIGQLCLVQLYTCSIASCSRISLFNGFVQFSMFKLELLTLFWMIHLLAQFISPFCQWLAIVFITVCGRKSWHIIRVLHANCGHPESEDL